MSVRTYIGLALIWAASLVGVGVWAQTPASEQKVISGADLGFRVERQERGTPVGKLVVRVNGQWVEVSFAVGAARLSTK